MHRVTLLSLALTAGCGQVDYMYIDPGDWGATPGGAQDIGAARDVIASGGVPSADAFPVEGLLSEHDLPVAGPPCDDLLCVRPALAVAPWLETGELTTWLQLGMSSGLPAAWERPPLDLVLIIDRSSSMSSDMVETLTGAASAVEQMGPQDRVAVVLFADRPRIAVPLQAVTDVAAIERELFRVDANGGWELMPAMEAGLELLEDAGPDPDRIRRLALFTCSYPGVGPNQDDPFTQLVRRAADERVGTSVYGVILGANPSLSDMLGEVRGGTTSFLESLDKVERVFVDDFDAMVTPLAYDLQVDVQLPAGASIAARYGVPGDGDLAFEATTVFPSRRRGAMLARLDGDVSNGVSASIAYTPEAALGWTEDVDAEAPAEPPAELDASGGFAGPGVRKGVALAQEAEQMSAACGAWHAGAAEDAIGRMDRLVTYLAGEAAALDDDGLRAELDLAVQLRENMTR